MPITKENTPEAFRSELVSLCETNFRQNLSFYINTHALMKSDTRLGSLEARAAALGDNLLPMLQGHAALGDYLAAAAPLLGKTFTRLPTLFPSS